MARVEIPEILKTDFGMVGVFYSDADGVDKVDTYEEMRERAKEHPRGKRAIRYIARLWNRNICYWEAWDRGIEIKGWKRSEKERREYIDRTIKAMEEEGIKFINP